MRRHGATVAGRSLEELTFRTIYVARNATYQLQAHTLGHVSPLNAEETELAGTYNLQPGPVARAWEYWSVRSTRRKAAPTPRATEIGGDEARGAKAKDEAKGTAQALRRNTARHWPRASSR